MCCSNLKSSNIKICYSMTSSSAAAPFQHIKIMQIVGNMHKRLHISIVEMGLFITLVYDGELREGFLQGTGMWRLYGCSTQTAKNQ